MTTPPVAHVFVSWGLWVADCPRDGCLGAEHFGQAPTTGHVGGLTLTGFRCGRCGLLCACDWPENAEDIWFVLSQRPSPETRNWIRGETLEDLIADNAVHGILAPGIWQGLTVADGKLVGLELTAAWPRPAIGG